MKRVSGTLFARLLLALVMTFPALAAPGFAVPLQALADPAQAKALIDAVCLAPPAPCQVETTDVWVARRGNTGLRYLIDTRGPKLLIWQPGSEARLQYWDFSTYRHTQAQAVPAHDEQPLSLYPALYPLDDHRFAVALVQEFREMYSGGGASLSIADFLVPGAAPAEWQTLYTAVPFSCYEMIRACFSEKDYANSPHCHDERSAYLTIQPQADGRWQFSWIAKDWPAHTAKTRQITRKTRFFRSHDSQALPETVAVCGGGSTF